MTEIDSAKTFPRFKLNRRQLMTGIAGAGVAGAVTGFPSILRAQPAQMTFPNSGGALEEAFKKAYIEPYSAKSGIQIMTAPYMDMARVKAMVENNAVDVDVLDIDATEAATLAREGLLEPIDYDMIDKSHLLPEATREHYVLVDVAAYVMAWNTKSFNQTTRPKTWAEYFDAAGKPGQRSLWKLAAQTMEAAAMGGGQARGKLYPIDLDLAFKSLDRIKPNLTWWSSGAQSAQLLIDGEVDLGTSWNGRLFKAKGDGAAIDYTFDNALYVCDALVIPKGAKNKKQAMEFIATFLDAQNQAVFSKTIPYGPVNTKAFELLTTEERGKLPNSPENGKTAVFQDFDYWASSGAAIFDRFNKWLVG
ncbi:ABC transporter substrate-binding protein [Methylocapsa sp. S129]|uniref:ABC transporter substrate-binding protein n=1 Tax=Methylocapsa sp. S129 TaxID=1641869 RepID=UPI00131CE461|nr:ABC transporter substrate-binding protein [Methylocapsa sp. S129]